MMMPLEGWLAVVRVIALLAAIVCLLPAFTDTPTKNRTISRGIVTASLVAIMLTCSPAIERMIGADNYGPSCRNVF